MNNTTADLDVARAVKRLGGELLASWAGSDDRHRNEARRLVGERADGRAAGQAWVIDDATVADLDKLKAGGWAALLVDRRHEADMLRPHALTGDQLVHKLGNTRAEHRDEVRTRAARACEAIRHIDADYSAGWCLGAWETIVSMGGAMNDERADALTDSLPAPDLDKLDLDEERVFLQLRAPKAVEVRGDR